VATAPPGWLALSATAGRNLAAAGLDGIVEIEVGDAAASLRAMIAGREPPFDFVFIDADKTGYVKYLELALQLSRPDTVILADNIIRNGEVMEDNPADPNARGARAYNAAFKGKIDGFAISLVK